MEYNIFYLNFFHRGLSNNPLVCGCQLTEALSALNESQIRIYGTCRYYMEGTQQQLLSFLNKTKCGRYYATQCNEMFKTNSKRPESKHPAGDV